MRWEGLIMKSKISCFNAAIFRKNATLYWPLWGSYLLVILGLIPGRLIYTLYNNKRHYPNGFTPSQSLVALGEALDISWGIVIVFIGAVATSMVLFYYLFQARSANMIHALPVTRGELYGTNLITGLLFLLGPQVIAFFVSMLVLLGHNVTCVEYFAEFMLLLGGITVLAYGIAVFCAMLTGQIVALPIFFLAVNILYMLLEMCMGNMMEYLGFGLTYQNLGGWRNWFSPAIYLLDRVNFYARYRIDNAGNVTDGNLYISGQLTVAGYLLVALILFVAAYLLYRRRNIECAGDLVAVPVLRPILRWGIGFVAGYLAAVSILQLASVVFYIPRWGIFVIVMAAGILFYFIAQMFISKRFKIFRNVNWKECAAFAGVMALSFVALAGCARVRDRYIPKEEDIRQVKFSAGRMNTLSGDDIALILDWQQAVIDTADEFRAMDARDVDKVYCDLEYELKNGKKITRTYVIPTEGQGQQVLKAAYEIEWEPQHFLQSIFGEHPQDGTYFTESVFTKYGDRNSYVEAKLNAEQTHLLERAVIADIKSGVLQKYNIWYSSYLDSEWQDENFAGTELYRNGIDFYADRTAEMGEYLHTQSWIGGSYSENYYEYDYQSFLFGSDCTHVIQTLMELGIMEEEIQGEQT